MMNCDLNLFRKNIFEGCLSINNCIYHMALASFLSNYDSPNSSAIIDLASILPSFNHREYASNNWG